MSTESFQFDPCPLTGSQKAIIQVLSQRDKVLFIPRGFGLLCTLVGYTMQQLSLCSQTQQSMHLLYIPMNKRRQYKFMTAVHHFFPTHCPTQGILQKTNTVLNWKNIFRLMSTPHPFESKSDVNFHHIIIEIHQQPGSEMYLNQLFQQILSQYAIASFNITFIVRKSVMNVDTFLQKYKMSGDVYDWVDFEYKWTELLKNCSLSDNSIEVLEDSEVEDLDLSKLTLMDEKTECEEFKGLLTRKTSDFLVCNTISNSALTSLLSVSLMEKFLTLQHATTPQRMIYVTCSINVAEHMARKCYQYLKTQNAQTPVTYVADFMLSWPDNHTSCYFLNVSKFNTLWGFKYITYVMIDKMICREKTIIGLQHIDHFLTHFIDLADLNSVQIQWIIRNHHAKIDFLSQQTHCPLSENRLIINTLFHPHTKVLVKSNEVEMDVEEKKNHNS